MWWRSGRILRDLGPADWLHDRFDRWPAVTNVVPHGFPAYARILHPVRLGDGRSTTWGRVLAQNEETLHPTSRWAHLRRGGDLPLYLDGHPLRPHDAPTDGTLPDPQLAALCHVLAQHTTRPHDCYAAIWDGVGFDPPRPFTTDGSEPPPVTRTAEYWAAATLTDDELSSPPVPLPQHPCYLFAGPLPTADDFTPDGTRPWSTNSGPFLQNSPTLLWPGEHTWCVATDIDFYSTYVAGPTDLIAALLAHPDLEALPAQPGDSVHGEGAHG